MKNSNLLPFLLDDETEARIVALQQAAYRQGALINDSRQTDRERQDRRARTTKAARELRERIVALVRERVHAPPQDPPRIRRLREVPPHVCEEHKHRMITDDGRIYWTCMMRPKEWPVDD